MEKALVLMSGGVDSTTCLAMAVEKYGKENVTALSVSYGQKHSREIAAAEDLTRYYGVEQISIDMAPMFAYSDCSLLSHGEGEIPHTSYGEQVRAGEEAPVSTYVPYRNGLFLSAAASIALSRGCGVIYYGAHSDDAAGSAYPDCSPAFNEAISRAIYLGSGNQLTVYAPFVDKTKTEVVGIGKELGVPYERTWSCYEGKEKPCGVCGTCRDRKEAFVNNGIYDID